MLKCDGQVVNLSLPRLLVSLSFGHIARLHGSADVKVIPTAFPPEDWKRPPGRPRITWMKTVLNDLESESLQPMWLRIARSGGCWLHALSGIRNDDGEDEVVLWLVQTYTHAGSNKRPYKAIGRDFPKYSQHHRNTANIHHSGEHKLVDKYWNYNSIHRIFFFLHNFVLHWSTTGHVTLPIISYTIVGSTSSWACLFVDSDYQFR